jgi:hypothetical protein
VGSDNCVNGHKKLGLYLGHDSIGITQLPPPPAWDLTDEVPSPNRNHAALQEGLARTADVSERSGAHNYSTFWEVVHGHGKGIFDPQRKIPQGTVTETVDCHRHDIHHEMTEQVEAFKRHLSARKLEHLGNMVRGETRVGGAKQYLDKLTGRILHLVLEKIDVRRHVMGDIPLLPE